MTQLNELRLINEANIQYLKKINENFKRNEIIKEILNDDACFFKMNKDEAYMLLSEIGILDEHIENIYQKLISTDEFYYLYKSKKIDLKDEEVLIKYPIYDVEEIFKKNIDSTNENMDKPEEEIILHKQTFFIKILDGLRRIFKKKGDL